MKDLGANGLVGLIALGFILWLFSNRSGVRLNRVDRVDDFDNG